MNKLTNCVNCGAVLTSCNCSYCGSQYDSSRVRLVSSITDNKKLMLMIAGGMAAVSLIYCYKNKRR